MKIKINLTFPLLLFIKVFVTQISKGEKMRKILSTIALCAVVATSSMAAYPSKTIKLIVPSKAGGSTDTTARLFIDTAKKYWVDADFIVVNKPGAGGLIGFSYEQRQKADGYTIGLMFNTSIRCTYSVKKS